MPNKGMKKCLTCGKLVNPRGMHNHARSHVAQQETVGFSDPEIPLMSDPDPEQKERESEVIEYALRQQIERTSAENGALRTRCAILEKLVRGLSLSVTALLEEQE